VVVVVVVGATVVVVTGTFVVVVVGGGLVVVVVGGAVVVVVGAFVVVVVLGARVVVVLAGGGVVVVVLRIVVNGAGAFVADLVTVGLLTVARTALPGNVEIASLAGRVVVVVVLVVGGLAVVVVVLLGCTVRGTVVVALARWTNSVGGAVLGLVTPHARTPAAATTGTATTRPTRGCHTPSRSRLPTRSPSFIRPPLRLHGDPLCSTLRRTHKIEVYESLTSVVAGAG